MPLSLQTEGAKQALQQDGYISTALQVFLNKFLIYSHLKRKTCKTDQETEIQKC